MTFSPVVEALIRVFEEKGPAGKDGSKYQVSRTVSLLAGLYEKARNAVEFRADHLIRRAAIERILKRRILLSTEQAQIAEQLIVELLWAKYLDSSQVDDGKVLEIQNIIDKYLILRQTVFSSGNKSPVSWDTFMGLLSSEIEEALVPPEKREALTNFFYQTILPKIETPKEDEEMKNILTYIAVEKAYAQSDDTLILFHLVKIIQPSWLTVKPGDSHEHIQALVNQVVLIQQALKHKLNDRLQRYVRKHTPPQLLLRDLFYEKGTAVRKTVESEQELEEALTSIAAKRYLEIGAKVRRAVVRSIIYLFFTKMVLALALEAPVDYFFTNRVDYLALGINIIFPPVLLFVIAGFIRLPDAKNSQRLVERIKKILYSFEDLQKEPDTFNAVQKNRRPILTAFFSLFYVFTYVLSFGLITYFLTKLHFNIASQAIFIFFVTLVSFFAYRIRLSAKEYYMGDRQGILTPLVDFFFLPILRVGRMLSSEIAKLNVFLFIFDFILEAPLKVILEFLEEWFRFVRSKKDEIM